MTWVLAIRAIAARGEIVRSDPPMAKFTARMAASQASFRRRLA